MYIWMDIIFLLWELSIALKYINLMFIPGA